MSLALLNLILLFSFYAIASSEDEYEITDCDRDLAGILCAEFKNDVAACAELMPADVSSDYNINDKFC
ncbi:hypothetical protein JTE90_003596 [Oedothorax gibbosus]|uniref:Uncharacterized protein n=1 Tax=Oedothorax gibbosus TaxID=931172 RepID=A0AAV6TJL9_9ARAC|nr:hypothetical protein JTE90_003596 [Oedothorax gibbosus]